MAVTRDKTFSDMDILRFIDNNLTQIERDYVICTILLATGNTRSGSLKDTLALLKDLFSGQAFEVVRAAIELVDLIVSGENRWNRDF